VTVLLVSGTGTGVGKTVVTAALAATARTSGRSVAVVKPAQTGVAPGQPGDVEHIRRLAGLASDDVHELATYAAPLAPATAARLENRPGPGLDAVAATVRGLAGRRDVVLVEGAGGLLVRFADPAWTLADLAASLGAAVLVVALPGLGTLNSTELTLLALAARGVAAAGVVLGCWPVPPKEPDLAMRANIADLEEIAGSALAGVLPEGAGAMQPEAFAAAALAGLAPTLGGRFDAADFRRTQGLRRDT
jgi:dethiobiotin synthetase